MNSKRWNLLLEKCTAGYEVPCSKDFVEENHLGLTFNYFKGLGVDSEGKKFLDVGCQGDTLKKMIVSEWTGIDILENKEQGIAKMDVHELDFDRESFDIIFCSHVLEHTLAPVVAIGEMRRVLKTDGHLIVGLPIYPDFCTPDHNYVLPIGSWEHLFERCALEVIETKEVGSGCATFHLKRMVIDDDKKNNNSSN